MLQDNFDMDKGGVKADGEKVEMDLLPIDVLTSVAKLYTQGAQKYARRNWEKGWRYGRTYAALLRHLFLWWSGEECDKEPPHAHHLDAVIFNAMALRAFTLRGTGEDDRPNMSNLNMSMTTEKVTPQNPLELKVGCIVRCNDIGITGEVIEINPNTSWCSVKYHNPDMPVGQFIIRFTPNDMVTVLRENNNLE